MPLINSVNDLMNQKQYDSVQALGKKIQALSKFTVYAYVNRQNINIHPGDKNLTSIHVHGCDLAYKATEDQYGNKVPTYWLLFGNWQTAKEGSDWLSFHFKHQPNSPYIENVVLLVVGDNDYTSQAIQKIDWSKIGNALTL
jgi:hypothetical protein